MATNALTISPSQAETTSVAVWRGLLLREWWAHRPLLAGLAHLYAVSPIVALAMTGVIFQSAPGYNGWSAGDWALIPRWWTFWMGVALALILGLALGGAETTAGLEEGSLSLPATRHQRFWARFVFAAGLLLAHAVLNTIAMCLWTYVLPRVELPGAPLEAWLFSAFISPLVILALAWTAAVNGGPRRKIMLGINALGLVTMVWMLYGYVAVASVVQDPIYIQDIYDMRDLLPFILPAWSIWMLHLAYRIYCTREIHALQDN